MKNINDLQLTHEDIYGYRLPPMILWILRILIVWMVLSIIWAIISIVFLI